MQLSSLPATTEKSKKRVGRGHGSGRGGHTSTRGTKGQKSRGSVDLFFEGTKFKKSLIKRLPLYRGKGKLKARATEKVVVNLKFLNVFKDNQEVNAQTLKEKGVISKDLNNDIKIKILGDGEISIPLVVALPCSKSAEEKIKKAGGKVVLEKKTEKKAKTEEKPRTKKDEGKEKKVKPEAKTVTKVKKTSVKGKTSPVKAVEGK